MSFTPPPLAPDQSSTPVGQGDISSLSDSSDDDWLYLPQELCTPSQFRRRQRANAASNRPRPDSSSVPTQQDNTPGGLQPGTVHPGAVDSGVVHFDSVYPGTSHPGITQPDIPLPGMPLQGIIQPGFIQPFQHPSMTPVISGQHLQQRTDIPQITNGPQAPPVGPTEFPSAPTSLSGYSHARRKRDRPRRIPLDLSTCLHISKLPPDCTPAQLLGAIRGVGKVWSLRVKPPRNRSSFSTAKLTLWDPKAADRLLELSSLGNFKVGNSVPCVQMNQNRTPPHSQRAESRVLRLVGPSRIVNQKHLEGFFSRCGLRYEVDHVDVHQQSEQITYLEFYFASYASQANIAAKHITRAQRGRGVSGLEPAIEDEWQLWKEVHYSWGKDPCE